MAYPVAMPGGYTSPAAFTSYIAVTGTSSQYIAVQSMQNNILGIGYDLTQLVPRVNTVSSNLVTTNDNVISTYNLVNIQKSTFANLSTKLQKVYARPQTFTNISAQVQRLDAKVAKMEPQVITQSISFLLGAFVALAFVLASKIRY